MKHTKLYLKLTTLPQTENLSTDSLEFELFKEKYSEAREYMKDSDVLHSYYNDASKTSSFARIYSMVMGVVIDDKLHIVIYKGNEKEMLKILVSKLYSEEFSGSELVCFNLGFNLEFITTRMFKHGLDTSSLPIQLKHLNMKVWNMKQCKGMSDYYKGIGWHHMNAKELFWTGGMPLDNIINGDKTYTLYKNNQTDLIDESDIHYLKNIVNIERKSVGEDIIDSFEVYNQNVDVVKEKKKAVKTQPKKSAKEKQEPAKTEEVNPLDTAEDNSLVLKRIFVNNEITKEDKKELVSLIGKKRLLKKDKPILIDMIHSLAINSDIFSKDSKKVVDEKLKIVEELINNL